MKRTTQEIFEFTEQDIKDILCSHVAKIRKCKDIPKYSVSIRRDVHTEGFGQMEYDTDVFSATVIVE